MDNTEEEKPIGTLFDSINFYSISDLEKFIEHLCSFSMKQSQIKQIKEKS